MARNPFKPSFGVSPPLLVGRDEVVRDFEDALDDGPGSPGRATLYTGARGTGKTVLLNEVQDRAQQRGWVVIAETATPGLVQRLAGEHLPRILAEHADVTSKTRLTGVTVPAKLGAAQWETRDLYEAAAGLRTQVGEICRTLGTRETGLLITVDELQRNPTEELVQLFAVVQHAFREELALAFAGAGLPSVVNALLGEDVITFLRRAERHHLGRVGETDVAEAIRGPITGNGREITQDALAEAVRATDGYPFLIQLVGHRIWRQAPARRVITVTDARAGASEAARRMGALVTNPALADCSAVDKTFLLAMAQDDGPSRMSDIADRMNVKPSYTNVYRSRLIDAELIEPAGRGAVKFALPYLREYLREHAAFGPE